MVGVTSATTFSIKNKQNNNMIVLNILLVMLNIGLSVINYERGRHKIFLFNAFAAGFCFCALTSLIVRNLNN